VWLHSRGLMHGDIYLHNTLRVPAPSTASATSASGKRTRDAAAAASDDGDVVRLSDLGAASAYDRAAHPGVEQLEVRAYGYLVADLLTWLEPRDTPEPALGKDDDGSDDALVGRLMSVQAECCSRQSGLPGWTFAQAVRRLEG
jgi:hypothetical protein